MAKVRRKMALPVIGWREWVSLPDLGLESIKAKIDTGARSSALHAFDLRAFTVGAKPWVRFRIHPMQHGGPTVEAEAEVIDMRRVTNPGGRRELRPVIRTHVTLLDKQWEIDLTLTPRWGMGFRMLLGRQAVRHHFLVDAGRSFFCERREIERRVTKKKTRKRKKVATKKAAGGVKKRAGEKPVGKRKKRAGEKPVGKRKKVTKKKSARGKRKP